MALKLILGSNDNFSLNIIPLALFITYKLQVQCQCQITLYVYFVAVMSYS